MAALTKTILILSVVVLVSSIVVVAQTSGGGGGSTGGTGGSGGGTSTGGSSTGGSSSGSDDSSGKSDPGSGSDSGSDDDKDDDGDCESWDFSNVDMGTMWSSCHKSLEDWSISKECCDQLVNVEKDVHKCFCSLVESWWGDWDNWSWSTINTGCSGLQTSCEDKDGSGGKN
ncbi:hypothetical protein MPTK1_6g10890 [Marchantia polymorpha subsp. ruderalis]|nr:hypothetical protein Mp_6g10890 [Marchantia polymorpha subsp. ruderalis]